MTTGDGGGADAAQGRADEEGRVLLLDLDELEREGSGPHRRKTKLPSAWIASVLSDTDARVDEDGAIDLEITLHADGTVLLRGTMNARFVVPCARCLSDAPVDANSSELVLTYVPAERLAAWAQSNAGRGHGPPGDDDDEGLELMAEDLDQVPYRGRRIDLRPGLGEQIAIAYPMRALCELGEACLGLCPSCGANLNDRPSDASPGRCHVCRASLDGFSDEDPKEVDGGADGGTEGQSGPSAWKDALRKLRDDES